MIAEQQLDPVFSAAALKVNWSEYGFMPEPVTGVLEGLRALSEPVSRPVGFRRCQEELLPWLVGRDTSWAYAIWDQDNGGPPIATFDDSAAGDELSRSYIWDHLLKPIFDGAVLEGPAAIARLHNEMSGDYVLLACTGGFGARGVWFCSPGNVVQRLLSSPGCAFYLSRRYARLTSRVGESRGLHLQHFAFPWGKWEEFLELAGLQLAQDPALVWESLDVSTGTVLSEAIARALAVLTGDVG
jgi:hypothetical protein